MLVGMLCPATGAILLTQRRLLQANLITHAVLPGIVIALAFGWNFTAGGLISAVLGALLAEHLNRSFPGREDGVMNTILAGFIALGVLLIPLLQLRVDVESLLFGDVLAANEGDLFRSVIAGVAMLLLLVVRYRDFVYLGVDPDGGANPFQVALASFVAFAIGALVPLLPWFVAEGTTATTWSVALGATAAALVGWLVGTLTERSRVRTAIRQVLVAVLACGATYTIGSVLGVSVS